MRYDHLVERTVEEMRQEGITTPSADHLAEAASFGASVATFEADVSKLREAHIAEARALNYPLPFTKGNPYG